MPATSLTVLLLSFSFLPPALNDNLQGFTPVLDENTGKITGYKTAVGGADTVFPFSGSFLESAHYISGFGTDSLPFTLNESYPIHISCENESIGSTYASAGIINVENMGATKIKLANGTGTYISAYSKNGKILKRVTNTSELSLPKDTAFVFFMRNSASGHVQYFTVT